MVVKNYKVSDKFVVVKIKGESIPGAIEILSDGPEYFALMSKFSVSADELERSIPALSDPETGEPVIQTGRIIVRWEKDAGVLDEFLESQGATLERNYGAGGIVASGSPIDPVKFAEKLQKIEGITKTVIQTLHPLHKKG